jgi:prophage regulatory protein
VLKLASIEMEASVVEDLLSRREVMRRTTLSAPTLWRRVKDGSFPAPVKIGPGRVAWPSSDVELWKTRLRRTDGTPFKFAGEA